MSLTYYKACLIIAVIIIVIAVAVTLPDLISQYQDPHQNDPNYCYVYRKSLNWRTTIEYLPNPNVAERVCNCTKYEYKSFVNEYNETVTPIYPWGYDCVRR
jgi:hypothetical protein